MSTSTTYKPVDSGPKSICEHCKVSKAALGSTLQRCSGCRTSLYCSRECQAAAWPKHKSRCESRTPSATPTAIPAPTQTNGHAIPQPRTGLGMLVDHIDLMSGQNAQVMSMIGGPTQNTSETNIKLLGRDKSNNAYLSFLSQEMAMRQLIDVFRLRCEDEHNFNHLNLGIYIGGWAKEAEIQAEKNFKDFLDRAEREKVVPNWWNPEKRLEVEEIAKDREAPSCIYIQVSKADILDMYADTVMPMKLRGVAERVYKVPVQR